MGDEAPALIRSFASGFSRSSVFRGIVPCTVNTLSPASGPKAM